MAKKLLTDKAVRDLEPRDVAYRIADAGERGAGRLVVRVRPSGAKDFFYRYRSAGGDRLLAIGPYDSTGRKGRTLAQARAKAREYAKSHREHGDLKTHLRVERQKQAIEARRGTLGDLLLAYSAQLEADRKVSARKVKLALVKHVQRAHRALWNAPAASITAADVRDILAKMVEGGLTRQMNIVRAYLSAAFTWGAKADHDPRVLAAKGKAYGLKGNPVALVPRVAEWDTPRDRVLDDDELAAYWKATATLPKAQRDCLRFLLALGGQRGAQVLRAPWSAYDFEACVLHLRDTKGRGGARDHLLPLTDLALAQLELMRSVNGGAPGPFSSDGKKVLRLETLTDAVTAISGQLAKASKVPPFRFGDIRRTCETTLARLGVSKDVRAWLLSHGRSSDVQTKHYDRNTYLPEKKAALELWAAHLAAIQKPKSERGAKVLPMRRGRR